ncbi:serine hydrolase [Nonlabens tegetincola]|uniref:serine hydrolase domain-containing protein n=1 Tax=Nonlabens tegetincola TaxID=323273 RepID=UPI000A209A39|nr:serine hydrolase domain-containing protein [Nonlabens tegetincola]ARN71267.1 serine hydrolase [Nonlabens tegetincola]
MKYLLFLLFLSFLACSSDDNNVDDQIQETGMYFPPSDSNDWETQSTESLNWNDQKLNDLFTFLENNETRAFIVLVNGKIIVEQYWNTDLQSQPFTANSNWYWASASKSLTGTMVGVAQEEGFLNIADKTSDYLGPGWTTMPSDKEDEISLFHQLTFTTGIDYNVSNSDCTDPACLTYLSDAGSQWYYHNATYTLLKDVLEVATGTSLNNYTDSSIENKIGMNGFWLPLSGGYGSTYYSTARDAARFGLLTLNEGQWDSTTVLGDSTYFNDMVSTSQNLNPSYGYLWWLNGKNSIVFPSSPNSFPTSLTPSAPDDMICALGKNGQIIDVIPSLDMVVVRMGDSPANELVPIVFHDELWELLNQVIN